MAALIKREGMKRGTITAPVERMGINSPFRECINFFIMLERRLNKHFAWRNSNF
jgi:hypothetical protein